MSPLVALAIALVTVSATPSQNSQDAMKSSVSHGEMVNLVAGDAVSHHQHHRQRRAIPLLYKSGGGQKPGDISKAPPEVAAMLQMGRLRFNEKFFLDVCSFSLQCKLAEISTSFIASKKNHLH